MRKPRVIRPAGRILEVTLSSGIRIKSRLGAVPFQFVSPLSLGLLITANALKASVEYKLDLWIKS